MTQTTDTAVLIVGAGPTGLTLACDLARRNIPFRLIDAAETASPASRAKGLQPRSLEVLEDLGLADQIIEGGHFNMAFRLYDNTGGYEDQDMRKRAEPRPDVPYNTTLMIPQWRTEALLRERLHSLGGAVENGVKLLDFTQDGSCVTTTLEGPDGTECYTAAWLVGCDGGHSQTRRVLGVNFAGETIQAYRMLVSDLRVTGLSRDVWHNWKNPDGLLGLAPLPYSDLFQLQATIPADDPGDATLEKLQQIVDERTGRSDIRLSNPTWISLWRANVRMVDKYRVGRAFLGGDAAHIHSPAGAQGMNTGIQDAYNLGWKLAAVINGADPALLDSYQEERLPIAAWVLGVSSQISVSMIKLGSIAAIRGEETLQLGLNYRGCGLAQDLRATPGNIQAGDRAPDAPGLSDGKTELRLFDFFRGPQFSLLAFGDEWDRVIDEVQTHFGPDIKCAVIGGTGTEGKTCQLRDTAGHAVRGYDISRPTLLVIRPDGYIGYVTEELSAAPVFDYLAKVARA